MGVGAAVSAAVLVGAISGCSFVGTTCTAIGWANAIQVRVPGSDADTSPVHQVAVCLGTDCTPGTPPTAGPVPSGGATPAALPSGGAGEPGTTATLPVAPFHTTVHEGDVWSVTTDTSTPASARVAVLDATGTTLLDRTVDLSWDRHGGSAQCGGPSSAAVTVR